MRHPCIAARCIARDAVPPLMQIDVLLPRGVATPEFPRRLGPRLPLRVIGSLSTAAPESILWIHGDAGLDAAAVDTLGERVAAGGRLMLTGTAAALLARAGIEPVRPEIRRGSYRRDVGDRELRGVMALPGQPLFHRFPGGVYLCRARGDGAFAEAVWERGHWPRVARVIGVEKLPIGCDVQRGVLLEARHGRGRVLALGAHLHLTAGDAEFDEVRARFIGDLFDYLVSDLAGDRGAVWPDPNTQRHARIVGATSSAPQVRCSLPPRARDDSLARDVDPSVDAAFTLVAADGSALYGRLHGFVDEMWVRAFRAFRDLRLRVVDHIDFAQGLVGARIHPDDVELEWRDGAAALRLRVANLADEAGFGIAMRATGAALRVEIRGVSDLRAFWPYPAGLAPEITAHSADRGGKLRLRDSLFGFEADIHADREPLRAVVHDVSRAVEQGDGGAMVAFVREFGLEDGEEVVLRLSGRTPPWRDGAAPVDLVEVARNGADPTLRITTGDIALDASFALVASRMRDFVMPLGDGLAGLCAGHDRSRRGWFTGRPGYAWFFGRDAFFCDAALLPCGAREIVRQDLRLAARFQDPLGKIHHEITPLGVVHHDAADSTAMFVDVLGRYYAFTRDAELVRELWPAVKRALAFLGVTDRDGDGLPENRGVGHGWMEGGTLAEHVDVEVYLAAFACRARSAAAFLADAIGDAEIARRETVAAERARDALRSRFFRSEDGGFAHAIRVGGARDDRDAVTTAVPWALALGEPGRENDALRRFATARARADWGSRMLPQDDPAYDPGSYQAGSVWPLFTGWTVIADFLHGRADSAWLALGPLLRSVEQFAPGCVQEVFRGDTYSARGIAAMQAWSHAAVLSGFAEGLLGVRVVPGEPRVILEPTLPGAIDALRFEGLRLGASELSGSVRREPDGSGLTLEIECRGEALEMDVAPFVPRPFALRGVFRDGEPIDVHVEELGDGALLRAAVALLPGRCVLHFDVVPDLVIAIDGGMCTVGAPSSRPRFIGRRIPDADTLVLDFELTGPTDFAIRTPGRSLRTVEGAAIGDGGRTLRIDPAADAAVDLGNGYRSGAVTLRFGTDTAAH